MSARRNKDYRMEVTTGKFTVSGASFARRLVALHMRGFLLAVAVVLAVCGVLAAIHDLRWIIVALMVAMLLTPMLLALQYFNHGLRRVSALNTLPHRMVFSDGGLQVEVDRTFRDGSGDGKEEEDPGDCVTAVIEIPYSRIGGWSADVRYLCLRTSGPDDGFLMVPDYAFRCREDIKRVGEILREKVTPAPAEEKYDKYETS